MKNCAMDSYHTMVNWTSRMMLLLIALYAVLYPLQVLAQEKPWHWVAAQSLVDKWKVSQGEANVIIKENRFEARLYDLTDKSVIFSIKGNIVDGKIRASVKTHDSDVGVNKVFGLYSRSMWKGFSTAGREVITLSDESNLFGLTREIQKSE